MGKRTKIMVSIVVILVAVGIHFFKEDLNKMIDAEWLGFFSGFFFAAGVLLPLSFFVKNKKE